MPERQEAGTAKVSGVNAVLSAQTVAAALLKPSNHARLFYLIAGAMLTLSLVISGYVGSVDVRNNPMISSAAIWAAEATSHFAILLLLPLFPLLFDRLPTAPGEWRSAFGLAGLGLIFFWLSHVTLMWGFRLVVYPLFVGGAYGVNLLAPRHMAYEFSKDVFTFALLTIGFVTIRGVVARRLKRAEEEAGRIALRSGATVHQLNLADVVSASAAANYIEVRITGRTILARMSLSKFAAVARSKNNNFVRVHRSHLVNREKIETIVPRGDGGARIEMIDGSEIPVSRNYRSALSAEIQAVTPN